MKFPFVSNRIRFQLIEHRIHVDCRALLYFTVISLPFLLSPCKLIMWKHKPRGIELCISRGIWETLPPDMRRQTQNFVQNSRIASEIRFIVYFEYFRLISPIASAQREGIDQCWTIHQIVPEPPHESAGLYRLSLFRNGKRPRYRRSDGCGWSSSARATIKTTSSSLSQRSIVLSRKLSKSRKWKHSSDDDISRRQQAGR